MYARVMNSVISARFTAAQSDLLYVGLRPIVIHHVNLVQTRRSPGSHPDILTLRFFRRRGIYNDEFIKAVYGLWKTLQENRGRAFRTSLDYIQVCLCSLAVRNAVRQVRHGHVEAWTSGIQARANRLLGCLEALRKKLKRTIIKTKGHNSFGDLASSWRQFLIWLRLNLLSCPCLIRRPDPVYRNRQWLIDDMVRVTTLELQAQECSIPPVRLLRKLVRDALKNVRRLRTPWTIPLLRRNPSIAAWWFGEYVVRRIAH
jgi:hypothetical protein